MSGEPPRDDRTPEPAAAPREPTLDELLDSTPEAVASRRARAAREEAARRAAEAPEEPRSSRRRLLVGGTLGLLAAVRVLERALRAGRR